MDLCAKYRLQNRGEQQRYDEEDYNSVKDLKRDTEDITDRYQDIIPYLDGVY